MYTVRYAKIMGSSEGYTVLCSQKQDGDYLLETWEDLMVHIAWSFKPQTPLGG